jgi:hypothetical protein
VVLTSLGIIPTPGGIRFVKHDDQGKLVGVFVAYTHTPTMFGGFRKWFASLGCRMPNRILYGVNSLRCRRCRGLKYASQSEASLHQLERSALISTTRGCVTILNRQGLEESANGPYGVAEAEFERLFSQGS